MSSAEAWVTAYTCGFEVSIFSRPVTLTGERIVFMISQDQNRAKPCRMRLLSPNRETGMETIPSTTVYIQIKGSKIKYERNRLSQPCFLTEEVLESSFTTSLMASSAMLTDREGLLCACSPTGVRM